MTHWAQIFTGLLFYAYVEIHQVRRLLFDNYQKWNCQRPVFSLVKTCENLKSISHWSSERVIKENTTVPQVVCFQVLEFETSAQLRSRIQFKLFSEKILLSQKLCFLHKGSCFSQCLMLSTALHCLLPESIFMLTIILSNYQYCPVSLTLI